MYKQEIKIQNGSDYRFNILWEKINCLTTFIVGLDGWTLYIPIWTENTTIFFFWFQ